MKLRIFRTDFDALDDAERSPKRVRSLTLHQIDLRQVEGRLLQFANLEALQFGWNPNSELPREIQRLPRLKRLTTLNMPLLEIPDWLFDCPALQVLMIRGCEITSLPPSIVRATSLRVLHIGNTALEHVPEEISQLRNLQSLELPMNEIEKLPSSIRNMQSLKRVSLGGNHWAQDDVDEMKSWFRPTVVSAWATRTAEAPPGSPERT